MNPVKYIYSRFMIFVFGNKENTNCETCDADVELITVCKICKNNNTCDCPKDQDAKNQSAGNK